MKHKQFRSILSVILLVLLLLRPFISACVAQNIASLPVALTISEFSQPDLDTIRFDSPQPEGVDLESETGILCQIPPSFQKRVLHYVILKFRKDPALAFPNVSNDNNSAWVSLRAFLPTQKKWIRWQDQFGFRKYAALKPAENPKQSTFLEFPRLTQRLSVSKLLVENKAE